MTHNSDPSLFKLTVKTLTLCFVFISMHTQAYAENWVQYKDEDGIFSVVIPENYKINKKTLRYDEKTILSSTELVSTVDQRPFKEVVKQFIVKYDQTFTSYIGQNDIKTLLNVDFTKYVDYYQSMGGVLRKQEGGFFAGYPGGEATITYNDAKLGLQTIRIRIIYTDTTRVEQVVISPEEDMLGYRIDDFFDSLQIKEGRTHLPGSFNDDWESYTAPSKVFSVLYPKRTPPYAPLKPDIEIGDKIERFSIQFKDPIYNETLFYNLYSYRFDKILNQSNVQQVLLRQHYKKLKVDYRTLQFSEGKLEGGGRILTNTSPVVPPKGYHYIDTMSIHAYYYGRYIVVQELVGNYKHVKSPFGKNLLGLIKFEPLEAHKEFMSNLSAEQIEDMKKQVAGQ